MHKQGVVNLQDLPLTKGELKVSFAFPEPSILVFYNAIPFAQELINTCNNLNSWTKSTVVEKTGVNYAPTSRNSSKIYVTPKDLGQYYTALTYLTTAAVMVYRTVNNYFPEDLAPISFEVLKYDPGEYFHIHSDFIRKMRPERILSMVYYLNEGFEGGETVFPQQKIKITPKAGSVVIFPSGYTHPHGSLAVKNGTKYACVTWLS